MKEEIKNKWVEALRSGKYLQGKEALRNYNSFCCLGVLCDLYDNTKWAEQEGDCIPYGTEQWAQDDHLSNKVKAWADMRSHDGELPVPDQTLAEMNDGGANFEEIADTIEKHWKDL